MKSIIPTLGKARPQGHPSPPAWSARFPNLLCGRCAVELFLSIARPFFGVYLVENLKATAGIVGAWSVVSTLSVLYNPKAIRAIVK